MAKGDLLGRITCPSCNMTGGMRITEDKNGHPFGYCEANCGQQLRVGPDPFRMGKFYTAHPEIKKRTETASVVPVASLKVEGVTETAPPNNPPPAGFVGVVSNIPLVAVPVKKSLAFDLGAL